MVPTSSVGLGSQPTVYRAKVQRTQDENSIVGDFIRAIEVYKPLDEDSIQVQQEKSNTLRPWRPHLPKRLPAWPTWQESTGAVRSSG